MLRLAPAERPAEDLGVDLAAAGARIVVRAHRHLLEAGAVVDFQRRVVVEGDLEEDRLGAMPFGLVAGGADQGEADPLATTLRLRPWRLGELDRPRASMERTSFSLAATSPASTATAQGAARLARTIRP